MLSPPLLLLLGAALPAQEAAQEPPSQAPQEPQEPATLPPGGYLAPDDLLRQVEALGGQAGVQIRTLAATAEGRSLLAAAFHAERAPGTPAVLVVADPDGDRPVASQIAWALCQHYAAAGASPLLDAATVYIVPVANPDAAAAAFLGAAPRRGAAVDEDRDGLADEDRPDDLNGDGLSLQMRVADPTGAWRADAADPRALRKANGEQGEAGGFRLLPEGLDDDGDRAFNEDDLGGVALEANWPHRWRQHQPAAGRFQLSEPEAKGLADFVLEHPEIALIVVLGSEDNSAKPPKGIERGDGGSSEPLKEDATLLKLLGERLLDGVDDRPRSAEHGHGNFADWAYFQAGILVLESAVWSPPLTAAGQDGNQDKNKGKDQAAREDSEEVKLLRWNDATYGGAGFAPWLPFDHPQLGPVEIGGWLPLVLGNPPQQQIAGLSRRWIEFLDSLAGDLPRLQWSKVEVADLGGGVRDARATLVSERLLPTVTRMGEVARRPLPVRVALELPPGASLLAGELRSTTARLGGLGDHREFRWVYRLAAGSEPARARAVSQTAGEAVASLEVQP